MKTLLMLQTGIETFSHPVVDGAVIIFLLKLYRDHVTQGVEIKAHRENIQTKLSSITEKVDVIYDWWIGRQERREHDRTDSAVAGS